MRRISNLVAVVDGAAVTSAARNATCQHLFPADLYSTSPSTSWRSTWFSYNELADRPARAAANTVAGTMLFSAAASSPAEEFHAKEPVLPKFLFGDVVLYRYDVYPFISDKVKAFLDYYDVPYKVVEVNISKREAWPANNKAPILMVDGDVMENKYNGQLISTSEALEAYGYITTHGNFNFIERIVIKYAGAASMYILSKQLKKKHDITDERAALYDASEAWVDALKGRNFLGGWKPNLADLAVFGVLRSIRHLKSGEDMVKHTRIGGWYSRMEHAVGASSRVQA